MTNDLRRVPEPFVRWHHGGHQPAPSHRDQPTDHPSHRRPHQVDNAIGAHGADWILAHVSRRPLRVLTHCNTGSLATAAYGTALGIIRELHHRGVLEMVYVDEIRPLLQGSRLTAWELAADGIAHVVQPDAAAASTVLQCLVDIAVCRRGPHRHKRGYRKQDWVTRNCADLRGRRHSVRRCSTANTIDLTTPSGEAITIEMRADTELLTWVNTRLAPAGTRAHNPAFDVTPARLVTALVTQAGVIRVARGDRPDPALPAAV